MLLESWIWSIGIGVADYDWKWPKKCPWISSWFLSHIFNQDCAFHLLEFIVALLAGPLIPSGSHKVNSLDIATGLPCHWRNFVSCTIQVQFSKLSVAESRRNKESSKTGQQQKIRHVRRERILRQKSWWKTKEQQTVARITRGLVVIGK